MCLQFRPAQHLPTVKNDASNGLIRHLWTETEIRRLPSFLAALCAAVGVPGVHVSRRIVGVSS